MSLQIDRVTETSRKSLSNFARRVGRTGWVLWLALALLLASVTGTQAQSVSVAAIGSGAVGVEAGSAMSSTVNPAFLGLRRHGFQLSLTPLSAGFGNNAFSLNDIQKYFFDLDHWDEDDKNAILALIPDSRGAWVLAGDASAGARMAVGPISLGGSVVAAADVGLDKDIFELLLMGNELDRAYSLANSGANAVAYVELGGSLSVPVTALAQLLNVKQVHVGGAYRAIHGVGFAELTVAGDGFKFVFEGGDPGVEGDNTFTVVYSDEGKGQAYDFGVAVEVNDSLHLDIALVNVGSITWDNVRMSKYEARIDLNESTQEAEFVEVFDGKTGKPYTSDTPQSLRVGAGGTWGERVRWAVDYTKRIKGPGEGDSSFGAGVELSWLRFLPLRVGLRSAMAGGLTYTAGFGLHLGPLTVDVATPDLQAFFMQGTEWSIAASTGIRF